MGRLRLARGVRRADPAFIEAGATTVTLRMAAYDQKGQFERVTREVLPALKAAFAGEI